MQLLRYHQFAFAVENGVVLELYTLNFTNKTLLQIFLSEQISLCHCTTTLNRTVGRRGNTPTVINGYMEKILLCFVSPLLKRNKQCAIKTPIADWWFDWSKVLVLPAKLGRGITVFRLRLPCNDHKQVKNLSNKWIRYYYVHCPE